MRFHREFSPVWRRIVRKSTRGICILDCFIGGRRKQTSNSLESMLRYWNRIAFNCILLSFTDDNFRSLSKGSYQTRVSSICILLGGSWKYPLGRVPYWLVFKRQWLEHAVLGEWFRVLRRTNLIWFSCVKVSIRFHKMRSPYPRIPFQFQFFFFLTFFLFQATFPNVVFSGTLISSIVHDGELPNSNCFSVP